MTSLSWQSLFNYAVRVGDALSQLLNVTVLFGKNANESVSGRAFRLRRQSWPWALAMVAINYFFFWQMNHCRSSYYADLDRARQTILDHQGTQYANR